MLKFCFWFVGKSIKASQHHLMMVFEFCFLSLFLVLCDVRFVWPNGAKVLAVRRFWGDGGRGEKDTKTVWCKRPCFWKKENFKTERKKSEKEKNKDFMSCVMVCDVVRFDLRHFSGFLAGFCVLCGKLLGLCRENGLERLKMRFCYSGIRIIMLLWCSKRGFCGNYARVRRCVRVYMYTL